MALIFAVSLWVGKFSGMATLTVMWLVFLFRVVLCVFGVAVWLEKLLLIVRCRIVVFCYVFLLGD